MIGMYIDFDKEDYDLIKNFCWHKHKDGYLRTVESTEYVYEKSKK